MDTEFRDGGQDKERRNKSIIDEKQLPKKDFISS